MSLKFIFLQAIRYTGAKVGQIYAEDNQFIGLNAVYGGAIYGNNPLLGFNFSGNVFKYNQAYDGGAIYKVSVGKIVYKMALNFDQREEVDHFSLQSK